MCVLLGLDSVSIISSLIISRTFVNFSHRPPISFALTEGFFRDLQGSWWTFRDFQEIFRDFDGFLRIFEGFSGISMDF